MAVEQIDFPYGNAFLVNTPAIDRMSQFLYNEQKQREVIRQKQIQALDDEFANNVSKIRDADVDEVTRRYGEWKAMNQQLMKSKSGITPQQQLELLRKKADIYKTINESKRGLLEEEDIRKGLMKDPDDYDDNAATYLAVRRKTPLSSLSNTYQGDDGKPIDLSDYNTYRYKGTNTDFQKILSTAAGTPRQVYQKEEPVGNDNLQFKITPYMYGNTPAQFKQSVLSSLAQNRAGRDAERIISKVDPKVIEETDRQFKAIPASTWQQMGVDKPQDLTIGNADSKAERFATYQAQLYALNNLPKEGTPVFRDNKSAIDARNFAQQKQIEAIKDANARRRLLIGQQYRKAMVDYRKSGTKADQDQVLEAWIQRTFNEGKDTYNPVMVKGKFVPGKQIATPMDLKKKYTIATGKDGDGKDIKEMPRFVMTDDKKYVVPLYPGKKSDWAEPIPIETFRNELGKIWLSAKDRVGEMDEISFDNEDGVEDVTETIISPASVSAPVIDQGGYTRQELKSAGWSDKQIDEARKSGKIKVK